MQSQFNFEELFNLNRNRGKRPQWTAPGKKGIVLIIIAAIVFLGLSYYVTLPAINYQETGFWFAIIVVLAIATAIFAMLKLATDKNVGIFQKVFSIALVLVVGFFLIESILSSQVVSSSKYANRMETENKTFEKDLDETKQITDIALMDTAGARIIGERAIGSLSDVVSQYEVSSNYTQIDFDGKPLKVAPLNYASFIRYMNNKGQGIPGYVQVDPVNNEAKYVKLKTPMRYSKSAYFSNNLQRHLRFQYPTAMFEGYYFEIDNKGNPYYICPVLKANAGIFGAKDVKGIVMCDPVSGDSKYYDVKDVPQWVDHVYDGELLLKKYNWKGLLSGGFINSIFGKKGCKIATDDYGYRAIDGDVWAYTGVTSVNGDSSNIAFVLMNMRTGESKYYSVSGADEASAMEAAEGQVQNLRYNAAFPSLINVSGEPTYVMILKDKGGLVKMYAMVNVEKYNIVATSTTQKGVFKEYARLLKQEGLLSPTDAETIAANTKEITIASVQFVPIEGNTYIYITDSNGDVYKQEFAKNEAAIKYKAGMKIKVETDGKNADGIYDVSDN